MHTLVLIFQLLISSSKFMSRCLTIHRMFSALKVSTPGISMVMNNANHRQDGIFTGIEICIYVDFLVMLNKVNVEPEDINKIKKEIEGVIYPLGIKLDELYLASIDYCFNAVVPDRKERMLLMQLWDKASSHFERAKKLKIAVPNNCNKIYYCCPDFYNVQIYDKETERQDTKRHKGRVMPITAYERNVLRLEYQIRYKHLDYHSKQYGTPRTFDEWATWTKRCHYLQSTAALFFTGDFYTVRKAMTILRRAGLDEADCQAIRRFMTDVSRRGIDYATARAPSPYYARKYIRQLSALRINPIPIPQNAGVPRLANPFREVLEGGR